MWAWIVLIASSVVFLVSCVVKLLMNRKAPSDGSVTK